MRPCWAYRPVIRLPGRFPAGYAVVAVLGLVWGLVLKARRPELYSAIGLGAQAVTTRLTAVAEERSR